MNFTEAIVLAVEKVKAWIQSGGVKWDHVSDKPFVKVGGDTLTWDGNTEGLVCVDDMMYKMSDAVPTIEDFANGCVITLNGASQELGFADVQGMIVDGLIALAGIVIVSPAKVGVEWDDGMVFPEAGVYFMYVPGAMEVSSLTIPGYTGFAKEQIDPKVLPEALQFGETETVIMEEQELAPNADMDGFCMGVVSHPIQDGDLLTVKYDGTSYDCEVYNLNGNVCFANATLMGENGGNGEPFCGTYFDGQVAFLSEDMGAANHIFKVTLVSVEKIQPKFYDCQAVFYINDDSKYLFADAAYTTKVTRAEFLQTALKKPFVLCRNKVQFMLPTAFVDVGNYVHVAFLLGGNEVTVYTAEYTA